MELIMQSSLYWIEDGYHVIDSVLFGGLYISKSWDIYKNSYMLILNIIFSSFLFKMRIEFLNSDASSH